MRKILLILFSLFCVCGSAVAASEVVNGIKWNYTVQDGGAVIETDMPGSPAIPRESARFAITIPSTLGGLPVTGVSWSSFEGCRGIMSVTIPPTVTSIGVYSFSGCSGLSSITIPTNVTEISDYAFNGCSGIGSVKMPPCVKRLGPNAFAGCSSLQSVTLSPSLTFINSGVFCGCSALRSVTIPSSIKLIGDRAFFGCDRLESVIFEGDAPELGKDPFTREPSNDIFPPKCVIKVKKGTRGWDDDGDGKWQGLTLQYVQ